MLTSVTNKHSLDVSVEKYSLKLAFRDVNASLKTCAPMADNIIIL